MTMMSNICLTASLTLSCMVIWHVMCSKRKRQRHHHDGDRAGGRGGLHLPALRHPRALLQVRHGQGTSTLYPSVVIQARTLLVCCLRIDRILERQDMKIDIELNVSLFNLPEPNQKKMI